MKQYTANHLLRALFFLFLPATALQAQPDWVVGPASFQYSMTVVAQIRINGQLNHLPNNQLGLFCEGQLRGCATPVEFGGEAYYFLNVYANVYKGDALYFRAFIGADQSVYESTDTLIFEHHLALGTPGEPVQIQLYLGDRPLIYTLPHLEYPANDCARIVDVQATDKQDSEGNGLTYSIAGGADAARFTIDPATGLLSWYNFLPDPGQPEDADGDNRYEADIRVTDASGLYDQLSFIVKVVPDDAPMVELICPNSQILVTSTDGTGDCGATSGQTAVVLPDLCAESALSYQLSGATTAGGSGQIPAAQVFQTGQTTAYYFLYGFECVFTITVQDDEAPSLSCPADLTTAPNIFNPCGATLSGIDAVFGDNCADPSIEFSLSGATTASGSGQASGLAFAEGITTVSYTATDGAGHSAECSFTVTVLACNTEFSGTILWETDGVSGVQSAAVNLTGSATGNDLTDANGQYLISLPFQTGDFTLKPAKNSNKLNGVTSADVTAIQRHATNIEPLPGPFKRIAADINRNNAVSTADATILNQALLGNPAALNQIVSWRFVPADYTFPNLNTPWGFPEQIVLQGASGQISGQDFYGIKTGDVVSTWADPANFSAGERLTLWVQNQGLLAGREIVAEFRAGQLDDLSSFQFALQFDPDQLQFLGIETFPDGLPMTLENFGVYRLDEGEIRVLWAPVQSRSLEASTRLFHLRFRALQSGALLSEALHLASGDQGLPGLAYNTANAESEVELRFSETTHSGAAANAPGFSLQISPNPFSHYAMLAFFVPSGGDVGLCVRNAAGQTLVAKKQYYAEGQHQERLELDGVGTGVFYVELSTGETRIVRRIVRF